MADANGDALISIADRCRGVAWSGYELAPLLGRWSEQLLLGLSLGYYGSPTFANDFAVKSLLESVPT